MVQQAEQQPQQANLSLTDLTLALQIIQVASQRNAFKPEEFEEVGGCYNRIFKFLEGSGAIQRTEAQQTEAPAAGNEETPSAPKSVADTATKKPAAKKPVAKKAATKSKGKTE